MNELPKKLTAFLASIDAAYLIRDYKRVVPEKHWLHYVEVHHYKSDDLAGLSLGEAWNEYRKIPMVDESGVDSFAESVEQDRDDERWLQLKLVINNAIWMYAPPETTLELAEEAATTAMSILNGAKWEVKS